MELKESFFMFRSEGVEGVRNPYSPSRIKEFEKLIE